MVGDGGFEPPKAKPADLQSVPFGHLGTPPYEIVMRKGGAGGRIRTPDLLITNQLLYQLSYTSTQRHFLTAKVIIPVRRGIVNTFFKMNQKSLREWLEGEKKLSRVREQVYCALCREELYPGDHYFLLDGQRICERCLERYAQRYFANERRRLRTAEKEVR